MPLILLNTLSPLLNQNLKAHQTGGKIKRCAYLYIYFERDEMTRKNRKIFEKIRDVPKAPGG